LGDREKYWIKQFDTYLGDGYNMSPGGGNGHRKQLDATKKKISAAFTEERRRKYSKRCSGTNNFGKTNTREWRDRQSKRMSGEGNPMYGLTRELNPNFGKEKPESFYTKHENTWTKEKRQIHAKRLSGKNNGMYGKKCPEERARKISESNKKSKKLTCPHCSKIANKGNALRWHFDNCKFKKDT
jgi:hypothetical protein